MTTVDAPRLFEPPVATTPYLHLPFDLICTIQGWLPAMVARASGWSLGCVSTAWLRPSSRWQQLFEKHEVIFIDNEWTAYDHGAHIAAIRDVEPKYATVRDYVTREQAEEAQVTYYSLDEVLDMADEVARYAENAIVIPKSDVLDRIPTRHVLGYSVPSSYGGTPIHIERFRGRRVHLLGGSWKTQRGIIGRLRHDVVSVDMNQQWKVAQVGAQVVQPDGTSRDLASYDLWPRNSALAAVTLSLGNIAIGAEALAQALRMEA